MEVYEDEPVIEHLYRRASAWPSGFRGRRERHGLAGYVEILGRPSCNLLFTTRGPDGRPSRPIRTLFLQETIRRVFSLRLFVVSYSHTDDDIDRSIEAIDGALEVYARAMHDGVEKHLIGPPSRPVFDRRQAPTSDDPDQE